MKDDNWCQTIDYFTTVHLPDLNPNYYGINNIKPELNLSNKVEFNAYDQSLEFKKQGN